MTLVTGVFSGPEGPVGGPDEYDCNEKGQQVRYRHGVEHAVQAEKAGKQQGEAHEGGNVVVRIRDFGPGIPEEELPHVKMKFYKGSSKARGNGIGLAVCEEIVTMHGGTLTLENAPGGGTLVTISLPTGEE